MSKEVVSAKDVPFGDPDIFDIKTLKFPEKPLFRRLILIGLGFFATENRFNMGMLQYKLPLIVIVAPVKVI